MSYRVKNYKDYCKKTGIRKRKEKCNDEISIDNSTPRVIKHNFSFNHSARNKAKKV